MAVPVSDSLPRTQAVAPCRADPTPDIPARATYQYASYLVDDNECDDEVDMFDELDEVDMFDELDED